MQRASIDTSEGVFIAWFTDRALAALSFPSDQDLPADDANVPAEWKRQTADALHAILHGEKPEQLPPIDLSSGTTFQQKVWTALLTIPPGATRSYSEVAQAIGTPGAARAVGGACGANPIPVLVPCHRVLAAKGAIGGFSAGLKWKRLLLAREGVRLAADAPDLKSSALPQNSGRRNGQLTLRKLFAQESH